MQFKMEIATDTISKKLETLALNTTKIAAERALVAGGEVIVAYAKINCEGQGLHKEGRLINSIQVYDPSPESVLVGSRGVVYAAAHEFGVTIKPKRAKMLSWIDEASGKRVFANQVTLPERAYLRPAIDEHKSEVLEAMGNVVAMYL